MNKMRISNSENPRIHSNNFLCKPQILKTFKFWAKEWNLISRKKKARNVRRNYGKWLSKALGNIGWEVKFIP